MNHRIKVLTIAGAAAVLSFALFGLYGPRLIVALGNTNEETAKVLNFLLDLNPVISSNPTTTPPAPAATAAEGTVTATLTEGDSVMCNDGTGTIYRFTNGTIRPYPNDEVAKAWNYGSYASRKYLVPAQCAQIRVGPAMEMPGKTTANDIVLTEGDSVMCGDGTVYRFTDGTLRPYPNEQVAQAWNPIGKEKRLLATQCASIPKGEPMAMPGQITTTAAAPDLKTLFATPNPNLEDGDSIACADSQGPSKVYYYAQKTKRYYPNLEIAAAWDPSWEKAEQLTADQCRGIPTGTDVGMRATVASLKENDFFMCDYDATIYRYMNKTKRPFPSEADAYACGYNPSTNIVTQLSRGQCRHIPTGPVIVRPNSATKPAPAMATMSSNGTATTNTAAGNAQEGIGVGVALAGIVGVIALVSLMQTNRTRFV